MAESLSESPPQQGPMCHVCFRDYSDSDKNLIPRILQCGHTYCTGEDFTVIFSILCRPIPYFIIILL